jgi:hypothetical protein
MNIIDRFLNFLYFFIISDSYQGNSFSSFSFLLYRKGKYIYYL